MKCSQNERLSINGICEGFPEKWPDLLTDILPDIIAIRQMYDKAKNFPDIVEYDVDQRAQFGEMWFQRILDGTLTFDAENTEVASKLPKLIPAEPISFS